MSKDEDVRDIVTQLQKLQLKQNTLISRLERLSESVPTNTTEPTDAAREFAVGDRVRIKNPGLFRETSGTIVKIGKRITVQTKSGKKIIRAAKNIIRVKDE
jgi:transcription antitermination factor NusG